MSYDIDVATHQKPEQRHLDDFLASRRQSRLEGRINGDVATATIHLGAGTGAEAFVEVSSPSRVFEPEDLGEALASAVLDPKWVMQIGVPGFNKDGIQLALAIAQYIAKECQGAVFDPQVDRVVWPRTRQRRFVPPVPAERIRLVRLEWSLPQSKAGVETAKRFLNVLRRTCREGRPRRFGHYEPLQGRLEDDDDGPFLEEWEKIRSEPLGMFFFKSQSPCFGGHVFLPLERRRKEGQESRAQISLDFDGRALDADERWRETCVLLFGRLAASLGAFYAHGYVIRNVHLIRGGYGIGPDTESYPIPGGGWWGIPPTPTWVVWFGGPYRALLEDRLRRQEATISAEGILLRFGQEPADLDHLRDVSLGIPPELVAGVGKRRMTLSNGSISESANRFGNPAVVVPPLG
jgi:hypothetical protein